MYMNYLIYYTTLTRNRDCYTPCRQRGEIYSCRCLLPRQGTSPMFLQQRPVLFDRDVMQTDQHRTTHITYTIHFSFFFFLFFLIWSLVFYIYLLASFLGESLVCWTINWAMFLHVFRGSCKVTPPVAAPLNLNPFKQLNSNNIS